MRGFISLDSFVLNSAGGLCLRKRRVWNLKFSIEMVSDCWCHVVKVSVSNGMALLLAACSALLGCCD